MTEKTQCKMHAKQIDDLQKRDLHGTQSRHKLAGKVSVIQAQMDDTREDIEKIQDDLQTIKENHISHIESDMAVLKEKVKRIDKIQWAVLAFTFATLVGIVVNTYITLK